MVTPATMTSSLVRRGATMAGLAVVYFAAAKLGLSLAFVNPSATAVWPPTGIALAAFLIFGPRVWPAIFAGALLAAGVSTVASATCGVISLTLGGFAHWADFWGIWVTWWLGDGAGALVIAPVLLLWTENLRVQ